MVSASIVCTLEVDAYWATVFECPSHDVWRPGVVVTPHAGQLVGYRGVFLFKRHDACRASAPPDLVEALNDLLRGRDARDVFRGDALLASLGDRVEQVVGPNWHGYVSRAGYRPASGPACRPLTEADGPAVDLLRDACGMSDWAEGSFDKVPAAFGCFVDRDLVAASNLTRWRLEDDRIGVVTHPEFRGRGHGAAVASAATGRALQRAAVAEWRARGTNTASIKVASRLGFVSYGENVAIRLKAPGRPGA